VLAPVRIARRLRRFASPVRSCCRRIWGRRNESAIPDGVRH
jgi:hypothetical protein